MKQSPLISIKNLHISISCLAAGAPGDLLNTDRESFFGEGLKRGVVSITPPAIGSYWEGQGGVYVGIRQYPDGAHYLIVGAEDLGTFAWSKGGTETGATSRTHGIQNTKALMDNDGSFPAAEVAANYTADGNQDYGLPSIGELNHVWQYAPDLISEGAYWSSSQRSANGAFTQDFDVGSQHYDVKSLELRVRPVRRLPIR